MKKPSKAKAKPAAKVKDLKVKKNPKGGEAKHASNQGWGKWEATSFKQ